MNASWACGSHWTVRVQSLTLGAKSSFQLLRTLGGKGNDFMILTPNFGSNLPMPLWGFVQEAKMGVPHFYCPLN